MKILVIRFGAIGDIVLASPVVRCLKKQLPGTELHFLIHHRYKAVIAHNPYIDHLHEVQHNWQTTVEELKAEAFDAVVDLQANADTKRLKKALRVPVYTVPERAFAKAVFTRLKWNLMPQEHQVDRNLKTVAALGVTNDGAGLDYFVAKEDEVPYRDIPSSHHAGYIAMAIDASFYTKRLPVSKWQELCAKIDHPIILLGGKNAFAAGEEIRKADAVKVYNACGKFTLGESADLLRKAKLVVANDTGLMHMAAAFKKPVIAIWGSTTPSLGMEPYYGSNFQQQRKTPVFDNVQVHKLWCRPCTDVGREQCPQGHFKCMNNMNVDEIVQKVQQRLRGV